MSATQAPANTLRLYELPAAIRDIEWQIMEADGELTPEVEARLDALESTFERKVEYLALLAREAKAEEAAVKQEEERLAKRRKAAGNRESRLKDYLHQCLTAAGVDRVEGERIKVRVQANPQPSIRWMGEDDAIPEDYRVVTVRPDLRRAKEELASGGTLPEGFTAEVGSHLRVW